MSDMIKNAIEALTDIRTSIECAAGCDEGIDPMAAVSEIMSAYGTAMASAYSRAAEALAALEQAGEPVTAEIDKAMREAVHGGLEHRYYPEEKPMSEIHRLGQEFDAGECETAFAISKRRHGERQSRGQAFDGEVEALKPLLPPASVESGDYLEGWMDGQTYLILAHGGTAALSSAKRG